MGAFGDLFTSILSAVLAFLWIFVLMGWMAEGEVSGKTGFATIVATVLLLAVGISSKSDIATYAVMLVFIVAIVSLPAYNIIAGKASDRELDLQGFERAHNAFAQNPANIGSRFEIAKHLAKLGQYGHAIAIAKGAESLLTDDQGVHQRGTRTMFSRELADLKYWQSIAKSEDFRNVGCPRCKRANPPGTIACLSCNSPFLLDIVRAGTQTGHLGAKVVVVWLCLAAIVAGGAILGTTSTGWTMVFPLALLVMALGGFLSWMLADRTKFV
jgi:hypothetical protein